MIKITNPVQQSVVVAVIIEWLFSTLDQKNAQNNHKCITDKMSHNSPFGGLYLWLQVVNIFTQIDELFYNGQADLGPKYYSESTNYFMFRQTLRRQPFLNHLQHLCTGKWLKNWPVWFQELKQWALLHFNLAAWPQPALVGTTSQSIGFMGNTNKSSKRNQIWLF